MATLTGGDLPLAVNIDDTKKVLNFVIVLLKAINQAGEDKKLDLSDLIYFFPVVLAIGPALSSVKEVGIELKAVNREEADALKAWVKEQVPQVITDEHVNQFITGAFATVLDIWMLIKNFYFTNDTTDAPDQPGKDTPDTENNG